MNDKYIKALFTDDPRKKCIDCGADYRIPDSMYKDGYGYPKIWTPRCPECQALMDEQIKREIEEAAEDKEKNVFRKRLSNLDKYLNDIGSPYPSAVEPYNFLPYVREISDKIMLNKWVAFAGTPGSGKTYLASLIMRRLAVQESLFKMKILYRSVTHLIGEQKAMWDEAGFNTGEELIRECVSANILVLEVNDYETSNRTTKYRNEVLFKIIDGRYIKMQQGKFFPTILIMVTPNKASLNNSLKDAGLDDAIIGRMLEFSGDNVYRFKDKDFRKSKAVEVKRIHYIE